MSLWNKIANQFEDSVAAGLANPAMRVAVEVDEETGEGEVQFGDDAALTERERLEWEHTAWAASSAVAPVIIGGIVSVVATPAAGAAAATAVGGVSRGIAGKRARDLAELDAREAAAAGRGPWNRQMMPGRTQNQIRNEVLRTMRALVQVESGGDPNAISPSGKHFGLLQMGSARSADVGIPDARVLLGDPELAIRAALMSFARSADVHQWIPPLMAISWKGGTGTLKKFLRLTESMTPAAALEDAAPASWRMSEYLRRFQNAYR